MKRLFGGYNIQNVIQWNNPLNKCIFFPRYAHSYRVTYHELSVTLQLRGGHKILIINNQNFMTPSELQCYRQFMICNPIWMRVARKKCTYLGGSQKNILQGNFKNSCPPSFFKEDIRYNEFYFNHIYLFFSHLLLMLWCIVKMTYNSLVFKNNNIEIRYSLSQ